MRPSGFVFLGFLGPLGPLLPFLRAGRAGQGRLLLLLAEDGERPLVERERGLRALELCLVGLEVRPEVAGEGELLLADVTAEGFVA